MLIAPFVGLLAAVTCSAAWADDAPASSRQPTEVKAFFREGQTFLTWKESGAVQGETYRIYRHSEPITTENVAKAERIAEVCEGSNRFREMWQADGKSVLRSSRPSAAEEARVIPCFLIQPII